MSDLLPILILFIAGLAAILDLKKRIIPNWLTLPTLLVVLTIQSFTLPFPEFVEVLQTFVFAGVFLISFFYFKILGGGDVKLLLVIACSVPLPEFIKVLFLIISFGGVQAVCVLFYHLFLHKKNALKTPIPYGVAIFLGYALYLFL